MVVGSNNFNILGHNALITIIDGKSDQLEIKIKVGHKNIIPPFINDAVLENNHKGLTARLHLIMKTAKIYMKWYHAYTFIWKKKKH